VKDKDDDDDEVQHDNIENFALRWYDSPRCPVGMSDYSLQHNTSSERAGFLLTRHTALAIL